jgi:hypothetical protein
VSKYFLLSPKIQMITLILFLPIKTFSAPLPFSPLNYIFFLGYYNSLLSAYQKHSGDLLTN